MLSPLENAVSTLKFYKKLEIVENWSDSKAHNFGTAQNETLVFS